MTAQGSASSGPPLAAARPAGLPRVRLCALPTPLAEAPRLARALGLRSLHVKRDDLTGFAVAGNKARKLELLLGDAVALGCDVLLTGGGPGSNFCAAAAAAARVAGLGCELVLYGTDPAQPPTGADRRAARPGGPATGPSGSGGPVNLVLARAWGARARFTGEADRASVDRALSAVAAELGGAGHRVYVVPRGGASPLGALAYALAARELASQMDRLGLRDPLVVVATGSGGTQAGLVAGSMAERRPFRVLGASVSRPVWECSSQVAALAAGCCGLLGTVPPSSGAVRVVDARGPGYGLPSKPGARAARLAADTEGLLLDPVFTAKALGVVSSLGREVDEAGADVVFVHTGGLATSLAALVSGGGRGGA